MASLSSSSSVSGSSSLGNTALRGFGGMASGIDRDAIIEQMTLGTTTKINSQESAITKLEWKQEIYRGISDNILDLYDNYSSYTSSSNLKDPLFFAKNIITAIGKETSTKFVSATGTSQLTGSVSIQAVRQLATSSVRKSEERTDGKIETSLNNLSKTVWQESLLAGGRQLRFGRYDADGNLENGTTQVFELPTSYKNDKGDTVEIDYFPTDEAGYKKLAEDLNKALGESKVNFNGEKISDAIEFQYDTNSKQMKINVKDPDKLGSYAIQSNSSALEGFGYKGSTGGTGKISIDDYNNNLNDFGSSVVRDVNTLEYLSGKSMKFSYDGVQKDITLLTKEEAEAIRKGQWTISEEKKQEIRDKLAANQQELENKYDLDTADGRKAVEDILDSQLKAEYTNEKHAELIENAKKALKDQGIEDPSEEQIIKQVRKDLNLSPDGPDKDIDDEIEKLVNQRLTDFKTNNAAEYGAKVQTTHDNLVKVQTEEEAFAMEQMRSNIQTRLDRAFGKDAVKAELTDNMSLAFSTKADSTVSVSTDDVMLLFNMGIRNGESNKVNTNGTLDQSALKIDINDEKYSDGLVINGVTIGGIDEYTSISTIMSKINSSNAGVKATYVSATGQFMLVSSETGAGREISLDSKLAQDLFGMKNDANEYDKDLGMTDGKNAVIDVSYGNGVTVQMERASNTFNLEGLTVTVSGTFGGKYEDKVDKDGNPVLGADGKVEQEWKADTSESVSFSAKADVDKAVEKVKAFFEAFNEIVTEVNTQVTSRPDKSYGPLTEAQKNEMSDKSIENWEKKAKTGLLNNDSTIRELSMSIQSIFSQVMNNGASYDDLKKIGISYSDNPKDGGVLVFDESAFRSAMETDPESVSKIFTGGGEVKKGLMQVVEDTFTPYATRFASRNSSPGSKTGGSYGRLIEEAGSEKIPTSLLKNQIYRQIEDKKTLIQQLKDKLKTEQDRYIKQFSTMESLISQMNSQSSWLAQITG